VGAWLTGPARVAFVIGNANHLANDQPTVDYELNVHLCPTISDPEPGHRFLHYVRFAMFTDTENPELAAEFMNFCLNSEAIPDLAGQTSGVPTSARLREIARESAGETGKKVIDIIEREAEFDMNPRPEVPPGAGGWRDLLGRAIESVAIEGVSISDASTKYINDLQASIDRAKD
jgi:ABC-type glycerol-3-phosphate transport system substrate-binding protein